MARQSDLTKAIHAQLESDLDDLIKLQDEQETLRGAYLRFQKLEERRNTLRKQAEISGCLVSKTSMYEVDSGFIKERLEQAGVTLPEKWESKVPTWELIAGVLRQFPKTQIVELLRMLHDLGIKVSRQATESALRTHDSKFRITTKGREKFVSLK